MINAKSYAAYDTKSPLKSWDFERRDVGADDVQIDIQYCGVCHSDIHCARGEWMEMQYPQVVGHEIVGKITSIGKNVTKHKVGDLVGVGCLVDSCRKCGSCNEHLENYCEEGMQGGTYMGVEKQTGRPTQGGYSSTIGLAEGMETAASYSELKDVPCWASFGTRRFDLCRIPESVTRLILAGDPDGPGRLAVTKAIQRYVTAQRIVLVDYSPSGSSDWAAVLQRQKRGEGGEG